jgi:hypothetical protein
MTVWRSTCASLALAYNNPAVGTVRQAAAGPNSADRLWESQMKKLAIMGFMFGMFSILGVVSGADKNDPTGTWKWKTKFGKNEVEQTLKLKNEDGKLTGTLVGGGGKAKDAAIEDGKFKDGEVSFSVTRERKGQKTTIKYSGKLSGDSIKGSIMFEGKDDKVDWEAKRDK